MTPWARAIDFFRYPEPAKDPSYAAQCRWADNFTASLVTTPDQNWIGHDRIAEQARRAYQERRGDFDAVDAKALEILRIAALVSTILAVAVAGLKVPVTLFMATAFLLLLLAILACLWARSPVPVGTEPTVREVLDGRGLNPSRLDVWLALGIYLAAERVQLSVEWKARRVAEASWLLLAGLCVAGFWLLG